MSYIKCQIFPNVLHKFKAIIIYPSGLNLQTVFKQSTRLKMS